MEKVLKLKYKIGEIELDVEGPPDEVEQQRQNFMNLVLPAAVEAMVRTHGREKTEQYTEEIPAVVQALPPQEPVNTSETPHLKDDDFSRMSLSSYVKRIGIQSEQDFILAAAYFDEKKNGNKIFSLDDVRKYYSEARRVLPTNPSSSLYRLAEKGYIMDAKIEDGKKSGKNYTLTSDGINYIDNYTSSENGEDRRKSRARLRKTPLKIESSYSNITADDLNLSAYPSVKSLNSKEQVILAMYIVTKAGKGDWFTVNDIKYLFTNIFEISSTEDAINGIFKRNKSFFSEEQDSNNKKAYRRKLLSGGKDFAESVIRGHKSSVS